MKVYTDNARKSPLNFMADSIARKLTVFILVIILAVIAVLGSMVYVGARKASFQVAQERIKDLRNQLAASLKPDTGAQAAPYRQLADRPAVKNFLLSEGKDSAAAVQALLHNLRYDSMSPQTQLVAVNRRIMLTAPGTQPVINISADSVISDRPGKQKIWVGKLYAVHDSVYYPVVIEVKNDEATLGYLIRWRRVFATQKNINTLTQLMGKIALYIGNKNGSLWTDLRVPVKGPQLGDSSGTRTYKKGNDRVIVSAAAIPGTPWLVSVELSTEVVYQAANRFLYWLMLAGFVLLLIGVAASIFLSRSFSRPLVSLTKAATRIADGDFEVHQLEQKQRSDEIGRLAGAFLIMNEKIRKSQKELEQLNLNLETLVAERTAQLQLVNEELESFTYSVSHDLRAPLRAINGYSRILSEDYSQVLDEDAQSHLRVIQANAKNMGTLIDDMLEFARIGRKEMQKSPVDFAVVIEDVLKEMGQSQQYRANIHITSLEPAFGDYKMLKQVWYNLISNAVKYSSKKEKPEIQIGSFLKDGEVVYYIKDNGAGFDMQYADKLFGVFQRLHSSGEFEGTGIGLAVIHRIITRHGGKVWAEAEEGKGASFYFTLS